VFSSHPSGLVTVAGEVVRGHCSSGVAPLYFNSISQERYVLFYA
jgi:hypothetical protein